MTRSPLNQIGEAVTALVFALAVTVLFVLFARSVSGAPVPTSPIIRPLYAPLQRE